MSRKCNDWIHTFLDWTLDRSEAPASLILWSGLFALSSVVKRRVCFPKKLLGSYNIYPNLYVVFVGPPGVIRKSTTVGYTETLFNELPGVVHTASTAMSDSKLVETLSGSPDGSITILSSEFSNFVKTSKEAMYDLLTDLFDGKVKYDYSTRMHGVEVVKNPCVNLLGATTPAWLSGQTPEHITGGGFSSRVVFIFENKVRRRQMYYDIDWSHYELLKDLLKQDLEHIATEVKGEFKHDSKATRNYIEDWYQANADNVVADEGVSGYSNRKHIHAHKLMMLVSIAERDDLVVTKDHFTRALGILEAAEATMTKALQNVGRNPYAQYIEQMLDFLGEHNGKPVPRRKLLARFYRSLSSSEVDEVLTSLLALGEVERVSVSDGFAFRRING